jgi:hypothetical protein
MFGKLHPFSATSEPDASDLVLTLKADSIRPRIRPKTGRHSMSRLLPCRKTRARGLLAGRRVASAGDGLVN